MRAIGVTALTASIINLTIGAGIFVLPAVAAGSLGRAAPIAYIVCAALMALIVTCFAAAGSRVSLTGGLYAYIEVAFGPFVGFLAGMLYWLMASFAVASVASAFAASFAVLWTGLAAPAGRAMLIGTVFASLAVINVRGVVVGARLIQGTTAAKLLPLGLFLAAGVWYVDRGALQWSPVPDVAALGRTAFVLIFAFAGVEVALVPSGEVREPARTVPRAVFSALAVTTAIYLMIQSVAQGLLGSSLTAYASAPLAEAASRVMGPAGRLLMLGGATASMFGYMSGDMLGSPRALYAFGRDGLLPPILARVHPRYLTPHVAILIHASIVAALAISSSFTQLAVLANVSALTLYLTCVAAAYELQRRDVGADAGPLILPGGPAIPLLAALVIVWLLSHATPRELAVEAIVLAVGALFYFAGIGRRTWRG